MNPSPLVSIVCLTYRQQAYLAQAVESVLQQDYSPIELILVDDASPDDTPLLVRQLAQHHGLKALLLPHNVGMNAAFNQGLAAAQGQLVMDLAGDDALLPGAVRSLVHAFQRLPASVAVVHADGIHVDEQGHVIGYHYARNKQGKLLQPVPSGWIYAHLVRGNCVLSASMMMRTEYLRKAGGYDETLSYEDYDIKVRLGREYQFFFLDRTVVQKRSHPASENLKFYTKASGKHLASTLQVCAKAAALNRNQEEHAALAQAIGWFLRLSAYTQQPALVQQFAQLKRDCGYALTLADRLLLLASSLRLPLLPLYRAYLRRYALPGR